MSKFFSLTLLLAIPALIAALFFGINRNHSWYQQLTVTIATPAGQVVGSSVTSVTRHAGIKSMGEMSLGRTSLRGEALAIEVTPGRWMFVLIGRQENLLYAMLTAAKHETYAEALPRILQQTTPLTVPPDYYPMMATFTDITDPKTVQQVDPADLAATFGPGVSLVSVMVEVTDEPVTEGIINAMVLDTPDYKSLKLVWQEIDRDTKRILSSDQWVGK